MRSVLVLACASSLAAASCLPEDTRQPPGRLSVTVTSDYPPSGFDTADGWHVDYGTFLVGLGEVVLRGEDCTPYNETDYARVFDAKSSEPQKVSVPVALGACSFEFRMRPPPEDAVLGEGVTSSALAFLRLPGSDGFAEDSGAAVFVAGTATSGPSEKRFAWAFRLGAQYEDCKIPTETGIHLESEVERSIDIALRSKVFFQHVPNDTLAELRFLPFAEADDVHGDADGEITLAELIQVPLGANASFDRWSDFGDYLYTGLVPKLPRYRGTGICSIGPIQEGMHGPGGGGH